MLPILAFYNIGNIYNTLIKRKLQRVSKLNFGIFNTDLLNISNIMIKNLHKRGLTKRLFRYALGVIIITLQAGLANAQIFTENFNGTVFPPVGPPMISNPVGTGLSDAGNVQWYRSDTSIVIDGGNAGVNPTTGFAIAFNTYDIQPGGKASFFINDINLSAVTPYAVLKFWIINKSGTDNLKVFARNGSNAFTQIGRTSYIVYPSYTEITIPLQAFSGGSNTTVDLKFEGTSDYGSDNIGIDDISVSTSANMSYVSNAASQKVQFDPFDMEIFKGVANQEIIKLKVKSLDLLNPLSLTKVYASTTGSTSTSDIANAKLWYTGSDSLFNIKTATQLGSTIASPSGGVAFTNFAQPLASVEEGFTNFWITIDIPSTATVGNTVDATIDSIQIGTTTYTTLNAAPTSTRLVSAPRRYIKNPGLSTSVNGRGPATQFLFNRSMGIFPSTEYPNLTKGDLITSVGYDIATLGASQAAVTGNIKVYMSNTTHTVFIKSTTWATTISDMILVYDGPLTINPKTGSFEITLSTPFEYNGNNLYVGYDWALTSAISTGATYYCNSTTVGGGNGNRSGTSGTAAPASIATSSAFRPSVHFGILSPANDLAIASVNTLTQLPRQAGAPHKVSAVIRNTGFNPVSAYNVRMSVSGANLFTSNKQVNLGWGESTTVVFDDYFPNNNGAGTVSVSVATDDAANNNNIIVDQVVNPTLYSYSATTPATGSIGYNTGAGIIANRYKANGGWLIDTVKVFIPNSAAITTKRMFGVVINSAGQIIAKSDTFTVTANDLGKYKSFEIKNPKVVYNEDFYAGLSQVANAAGFSPVGVQFESPARTGAYYTFGTNGGTATEANTYGTFMIDANVAAPLPPPVVNLGADTVICVGASVVLNAGNPGLKYTWSTGDTTQTISVNASGVYSVIVTNSQGYPVTDSRIITVGPAAVTAVVSTTHPKGACVGTPITFTASGLNLGASPTYAWKKNGVTISGANASTYTSTTLADNDTIACIATSNSACISGSTSATASIIVDIFPILPVNISIASNDTSVVCKNTSLTFTATPTNGGPQPTYLWTINSSPLPNETGVTFTTNTLNNNDTVRCIIYPSESCDAPKTSNAFIAKILASADATFTVTSNLKRVVQFNNSFKQFANYSWDFGDGSTAGTADPSHTYAKDSTYTVKLIANNNCGVDTFETSVIVATVDVKPVTFVGLNSGCTLSNIQPIRISVQNLRNVAVENLKVSYSINNGPTQEGTIASLAAGATSSFPFTQRANLSADGTYVIKAWTSAESDFNEGNDTITITVINQAKPNAAFVSTAGINGAYTFTNNTTSDVTATYSWNFGDNSTSTNDNPSHTYTQSGVYTVMMIATNTCGNDTATENLNVTVVGVELQSNEKYARAYPNPNNGLFNLDLKLMNADDIIINAYNVNGQIVYTQNLGVITEQNVSLDLSTLSAGIYNLSIQGKNTHIVKRVNILK